MIIRETMVDVDIRHTALETVVRETYYGLQMVSRNFTGVEYVDAANFGLHPTQEASTCGDITCRRMRLMNEVSDFVEIGVCETDLGAFLHNRADHSAFNMQYGKCYFNLIRDTEYVQRKDEVTATKGYYHFYTQ